LFPRGKKKKELLSEKSGQERGETREQKKALAMGTGTFIKENKRGKNKSNINLKRGVN